VTASTKTKVRCSPDEILGTRNTNAKYGANTIRY
jgi:hypothetical protein